MAPSLCATLVFVVREDQVDAAGVHVDRRLAEQPEGHRRALDVPARTPGADAVIPRRLVRPGRLPQHEVARVFLAVIIAVDARPGLDAVLIEPRELAVLGEGGDAVVDRPFAAIRVAARVERLDHLDHRAQVRLVGRARHLFHRLEPERRGVFPERGNELVGVLAQRHPGVLRAGNRAIVDVGEVHDLVHAEAAQVFEGPPQHVDAHERPEVPDVAAVVHGEAARVHAHGIVA